MQHPVSLSLPLHRHINSASVSHLLEHTSWPRLHTLRLISGLGCSSASLVQFLKVHPGIEELVLGRMLPGRSWEEFGLALHGAEEGAEDKPVLPRLKTLECSSAQAAALLMRPTDTYARDAVRRGDALHDRVGRLFQLGRRVGGPRRSTQRTLKKTEVFPPHGGTIYLHGSRRVPPYGVWVCSIELEQTSDS
ncbi:hypothetical protein EW146_g2299 [Bondarzewia mesenterica]|uniref:Uncharacterized protein n=1 Tax=Bondarzewia mesenterica TaxID=1095465 RepID=A0A4S4M1J2_9AGAM|nr:hypothetical protein EW146_g2299 [Bondarzewia mesenterica]